VSDLTLVIGNRNYSSWSLRAWLAMHEAGLDFKEEVIPLDLPNTAERITAHSPAGRVPVLHHGDLVVWDTIAIIEYLAEAYPGPRWWPDKPEVRAVARAVSAEMHAGFAALRNELPMNVRAVDRQVDISPECQADIVRIQQIWTDCRNRFGGYGDFLFGDFSAADAMFAPVVSRFFTYGIDMDGAGAAYADAVWQTAGMGWWRSASADEPFTIPEAELDQSS